MSALGACCDVVAAVAVVGRPRPSRTEALRLELRRRRCPRPSDLRSHPRKSLSVRPHFHPPLPLAALVGRTSLRLAIWLRSRWSSLAASAAASVGSVALVLVRSGVVRWSVVVGRVGVGEAQRAKEGKKECRKVEGWQVGG